MHLALDIGNTRTKWATFDGRHLKESGVIQSKFENEFAYLIENLAIDDISVASVVKLSASLEELLFKNKAQFISTDTLIPINNSYETPETLGIDRICAAVGAKFTFPKSPVLVIDIGTCIKYEFVSEDGTYQGGNIAPGMEMRFKSLHEYTSKLPQIKPKKVDRLFGKSTSEAIRLGVQQGMLLEMEAIIEKTTSLHNNTKTIITGGDSSFFANEFKTHIFADLLLVLRGLNEIYLHKA